MKRLKSIWNMKLNLLALLQNRKFSVILFCLTTTISSLILIFLLNFIIYNKALTLQKIEILGGTPTTKTLINKVFSAYLNQLINTINLSQWAEIINTYDLDLINIKRILPDKISIEVREKIPFAIIKDKDTFYIDRTGKIFRYFKQDLRLPIIHENKSTNLNFKTIEALIDYESLAQFNGPVRNIWQDNIQGLVFEFDNDLKVDIGNNNFLLKWNNMKHILDSIKQEGKEISYIDLNNISNERLFTLSLKNKMSGIIKSKGQN
jgi:cell division septal protein FtsQ